LAAVSCTSYLGGAYRRLVLAAVSCTSYLGGAYRQLVWAATKSAISQSHVKLSRRFLERSEQD
jgi:hypothetical protein